MPSNRRGEIRASASAPPRSSLSVFDSLPSCGRFRACRAKHQKLKTGTDQSPGDKKTEAESEQRKFKTSSASDAAVFLMFRAFARALLSTNLLCCSSQRTRRARLRASQSDVLEGGTPAITQVRHPPPRRSSASPLCSRWLSNSSHPECTIFFFLSN